MVELFDFALLFEYIFLFGLSRDVSNNKIDNTRRTKTTTTIDDDEEKNKKRRTHIHGVQEQKSTEKTKKKQKY